MAIINLYTTRGCPKCNILRKACVESSLVQDSDFREIIVNPNDKASDPTIAMLIEHKMSSFPVLLIDNTFLDFDSAMSYVRSLSKEK